MVEAVLRLGRLEHREWRLWTNDALEGRDDLGDHASIASHGAHDGVAPRAGLRLALGQELANQVLQRRHDGAERYVALQLVELAADEVAVLLADGQAHVLHERCLADARRAGQNDELGAAGGGPPQCHRQGVRLAAAPIQVRRRDQARQRLLADFSPGFRRGAAFRERGSGLFMGQRVYRRPMGTLDPEKPGFSSVHASHRRQSAGRVSALSRQGLRDGRCPARCFRGWPRIAQLVRRIPRFRGRWRNRV